MSITTDVRERSNTLLLDEEKVASRYNTISNEHLGHQFPPHSNGEEATRKQHKHNADPQVSLESNPVRPNKTRVISITSGKGGVGKTMLSVNMAISLAQLGYKVLLFDGDLGLANINIALGIIPEYNIQDVLKKKKSLREIIIKTKYGIDIIAGVNGVSRLANLTPAECKLFLDELLEITEYDIMLIDTGAGLNYNVTLLAGAAEKVLVVTTPEPTSVTDAYGMIKSILGNDRNKSIDLIINRVFSSIEAQFVINKLSNITNQFLHAKIRGLGFIFEENLVQKSINQQKPHILLYPTSKSSTCINLVSAKLVNSSYNNAPQGVGGFFRKIIGMQASNEEKGLFIS